MKVDSIWHGRFWTGDSNHPEARTLAVHRGRILAVDDIDGLTADQECDFGESRIIPGLHDAHHHTLGVGEQLATVDLRYPAVTSLDEAYAAIKARADTLPAGSWVRASGYDQNRLGAHPTADALDKISGGRPVIVEHVSHHMIVANTAAFERVGAAGRLNYPDVAGGRVERDDEGRAVGLLQENAGDLIHHAAAHVTSDETMEALRLASQQSVSYGLTSLTEPGVLVGGAVGLNAPVLDIYQRAIACDVLRPRMTVMPFHQVMHELDINSDGIQTLDLGVRTGFGDDRLRFGPVKIISDGSLIGRSAAVHDCYCGETNNKGVMVVDPDQLKELIAAYQKGGWTVATHAIGDHAIDHVLDAIEAAQVSLQRPARHRIEHFAIATDAQVSRAAKLGVIPVPQGVFISEFGDGIISAIGESRSQGTYRMRSLLNAGMVVAGSSDSPVSDANPFVSMHDLVNRKTSSGKDFAPGERVSVEDALRAYTFGSAYAVEREAEVGTLRQGMLADFVVLNEDLLRVDAADIKAVAPVTTVIGGDVVYRAEA